MANKDKTKTNLSAEAELKKFVNSLVAEKKFEVEPEVLKQIKEDVYERAENIVNATIMANTPPEKLEELERLLKKHDRKAVEEFCNTNIPDLEQKAAESLAQFAKVYLGVG